MTVDKSAVAFFGVNDRRTDGESDGATKGEKGGRQLTTLKEGRSSVKREKKVQTESSDVRKMK